MHFNNHICWYLDNTFCGSLHATHASGFDVKVFFGVLCIGLWMCGFLLLFRVLYGVGVTQACCKTQVKRRKMRLTAEVPLIRTCCSTARTLFDQAGRWQEALLNISDCLSHNKLVLFLLIVCPVVYFDVIQLCAPDHAFCQLPNPSLQFALARSSATLMCEQLFRVLRL